jgi:hypothetical protein
VLATGQEVSKRQVLGPECRPACELRVMSWGRRPATAGRATTVRSKAEKIPDKIPDPLRLPWEHSPAQATYQVVGTALGISKPCFHLGRTRYPLRRVCLSRGTKSVGYSTQEAEMTSSFLKTTFAAALLLGAAIVPAVAIDLGVTIGGGPNVDASATVGNTNANVHVGQGSGPLATVESRGTAGGGSQTDVTVNLGSLLDGIDLPDIDLPGGGNGGGGNGNGGGGNGNGGGGNGNGGGAGGGGIGTGGGGGGGGGGFQTIVDNLSAADRALLDKRCRGVLVDPALYEKDMIEFCRMIIKLSL